MKRSFLFFALLFNQFVYAQAPKELQPILEVAGKDSGAALGYYVKGIGDLNRDGFDDVAVSAPRQYKTYVYYGGQPMNNKPALVFEGGGSIAVGDFNGDGWIDLVIEKWFRDTVLVYLGGPVMDTVADVVLHGEHSGDNFGYESITSGDLNGDGYDDLVIGAYQYPNIIPNGFNGKIYIYAGGSKLDSIPRVTFIGDTSNIRLGYSITTGDLNSDGKKDLIVLGWNTVNPNSNFWYYYLAVYLGDPIFQMERNYYIESRNVQGGFVEHVTSFDADSGGSDDILVNKIYIFKGGSYIDTVPSYYVAPPNNDTLAYGPYPWVDGGGDYNHDGIKDILLSSTQGYFGGVRGFFVMLSKRNSPGHAAAYRVFSQCCGQYKLTGRPQNAGDVNGDGVDDIIIGAPSEPIDSVSGFFGIYSGDSSLVVAVADEGQQQKSFRLEQNYPNPFNPETSITYSISTRQFVSVKIFDSLGREIASLVNEMQDAGPHKTVWNGKDARGKAVASGLYYYQLQTKDYKETKKLIYIK